MSVERPRCKHKRMRTVSKVKKLTDGTIRSKKVQGMYPCGMLLDKSGVCWFCRTKARGFVAG